MKEAKEKLEQLKSEGDLNLSPQRAAWLKEHIDDETRHWLNQDAKYFDSSVEFMG